MINNQMAMRSLMIYALVLPVAIFLGYMLATPLDIGSFAAVGLVLTALVLPLLLKWHHPILVFVWNTTAVIFFLPGRPQLWLLMGFLSLAIVVFQKALSRKMRLVPSPSVFWPAMAIVAVVLVTARLTGGIHLGSMGGETAGGKRYIYMLAGIAGFIAMACQRIPPEKANFYFGLFFLSWLTVAIGNLINVVGPSLYFIFWIFPIDYGAWGTSVIEGSLFRSYGITVACMGGFFYMLGRYGVRGLLQLKYFKRLIVALLFFIGGMVGGFRSAMLVMLMVGMLVFWLEGLLRSRYLLVLLGMFGLSLIALPFASKLPLSIQRTLSVLPIDVDPAARISAESSSEWRIQIWQNLLPDVPRYFWLGKGLSLNAEEFAKVAEKLNPRAVDSAEVATEAGDYHNGPLSVIIPFGIWGVIAWLWFLFAGGRALYLNYANSDPALKTINTLLYAYFVAKTIMFFAVMGGFYTDVAVFCGIVALSISLNHGIRRKPVQAPAEQTAAHVPMPGLAGRLSRTTS